MMDVSAHVDGAEARSAQTLRRVWLLDDSPLECEMARRALGTRYSVEVFGDGPALLERLVAVEAPDLLLLDWQLPGMSGLEVCKFLRQTHDQASLPILMLTSHGHKADIVDALAAGANDYLTKPYDASELAARVATLVRISALMTLADAERVRAEDANRAKDDFLAVVSHELRTPLSSILGWVRLLRGGTLSAEKQERALETIERNARAQTQLIEDLLDTSRITSGKLRLELAPVDLVSTVEMAVESARPAAAVKGITLESTIGVRTVVISGDGSRLAQVVSNLLTNALKFTPRGGRVHVSILREGGQAVLRVTDNGQGISPQLLPHVFERFRQADGSSSRARGGLGLGLAIVHHLVEAHEGSVEAESAGEGQGATLIVRLPALVPAGVADALHVLPMEGDAGRLHGVSVLLVDDDGDLREILAIILEGHGAKVAGAGSIDEALEMLRTATPRVLVSDIDMPGGGGLALIRRVRELPLEQGGAIPAVALTGHSSATDRARAMMAGYDIHVPKPVEPLELLAAITNLLARTRLS